MSASPIARQVTQSQGQAIPKRVLINDPSQLPHDYSSTPGGTLYSTTPGGTRIIYDRAFLLQMRNSPVACTPPKNLPVIPGVTCDASPKDKVRPARSPVPPRELEQVEEKKQDEDAQFDMDIWVHSAKIARRLSVELREPLTQENTNLRCTNIKITDSIFLPCDPSCLDLRTVLIKGMVKKECARINRTFVFVLFFEISERREIIESLFIFCWRFPYDCLLVSSFRRMANKVFDISVIPCFFLRDATGWWAGW